MTAKTKTLLILLTLLCTIVLLSLLMINAEEVKEIVDNVPTPDSKTEFSFSFRKALAYVAYYTSKLIGFLFGID